MEKGYYKIKYAKYFLNILIWILALTFLIFGAPYLIRLTLPFIFGWVVALLANPLVRMMDRRLGIKPKLSSAIIILLVFFALALILYASISKLFSEASAFFEQLPAMYQSIAADVAIIEENIERMMNALPLVKKEALIDGFDKVSDFLLSKLQKASSPTIEAAGTFAKNIPSALITTIITILSAYFMIADKEKIAEYIKSHFSEGIKARGRKLSKGIKQVISGYLKAQVIILAFVGLILFVGLLILKVRFALLFSVLIALLDFLPFFGTGAALGPWAVYHFLAGNYQMTAGLAIIYVVSQLVRRIIEPKVLGDTIGMNPMLTMALMYIGYKTIGVMGLIFAAPVGMLLINLDRQGVFDNIRFIIKDICRDLAKFKDISRYRGEG